MKASVLDLRYRMKAVLAALDRGEPVTVLHRGREKARLVPIEKAGSAKPSDDAAFGIWKGRRDLGDVTAHVRRLRRGRQFDL